MQIGIDSFVEMAPGANAAQRTAEWLEEVKLADRVGVDAYGVGEHHRPEYIASAPAVMLAAAAAVTETIRLSSAVTVLSSDDPVRVFQDFATVDLLSQGRAEIIVGRGSFIESYPLFGFDLEDYDELFREKLELLLKLREQTNVTWSGRHRAALSGQGVYPRPMQKKLPISLGVGGTPASFARAGTLGLPLTVAIIGGEPHRFRPLIDHYREAGARAGHALEDLVVHVHGLGFVADTTQQAKDDLWPSYNATFSRIGRERGWGPTTRAAFEAQCGPTGAFLVGDAQTVAEKMWHISDALGGVERIAINLSGGTMAHEMTMRSIELLGTKVRQLVQSPSR